MMTEEKKKRIVEFRGEGIQFNKFAKHHPSVKFSVRYCEKISSVISTKYRIIFRNEIYDIVSGDHFSYTKKYLKFKRRKARR